MHNLKNLRKNIDIYKKKFKDRNVDFNISDFNEKDKLNRDLISKKEKLEQEKKSLSKSKNESNFLKSKKISEEILTISKKQSKTQNALDKIIYSLPNLAIDDVPVGKDDKFNNLTDELGIPELEKLYFDEFDYVKGDYSSKSVNAKKIYTDDLKSFYETFTGNPFNPDIIKSFKDIKLRDFKYDEKCKDGQYKQEKKGRNITFKEYAIRLRLMLNNIITRQNKLIKILNNVFYINKKSNPVTVSIHYDLNEINLDKLIKEMAYCFR